nr:zinc finger, CCHC-type [Tanacetum cinerariifolium]
MDVVFMPVAFVMLPAYRHPAYHHYPYIYHPHRMLLQHQENNNNLNVRKENKIALKSRWSFPGVNMLRLNTNGSLKGNRIPSSLGGLIRDGKGRWICGYMGKIKGKSCTAFEAVMRLGWKEADYDHPLKSIMDDITKMMKEQKCVMLHTRRDGNQVDDILIFGTDQNQVDKTKKFLSSRFSVIDIGEADVILGIKIKCENKGIVITRSHYIEKILKNFNREDCSLVRTPTDLVEKLSPNTWKPIDQLEYSRAIGFLMYTMTGTRPDIAYAIGRLSRFTSNPSRKHWKAITRIFKYLRGTKDYGLSYVGYPSVLEGYSDASWINHVEDSSSMSEWVFLLRGGAISWASKNQTCITGSTIECGFVALAATESCKSLQAIHSPSFICSDGLLCPSAGEMKNTPLNLSYVYQCVGCDSFHLQPLVRTIYKNTSVRYLPGFGLAIPQECTDCGKKYNMGRPIWLAPIHDQDWVTSNLADVKSMKERYPAFDRISAVLTTISEELQDVPLFLSLHNLYATLKCISPSAVIFRGHMGYYALLAIFRVKNKPVKSHPSKDYGSVILAKEPMLHASFARVVASLSKAQAKKVAHLLG